MLYDSLFNVGDLVVYKSWYEGNTGWISTYDNYGIVLEVIEIDSVIKTIVMKDDDDILYDIKVYWFASGQTEILPDLLIDHYKNMLEVKNV